MKPTMPKSFAEIRSIFFDALQQPQADWPAYLDHACAGNAELRQQVELLLNAHVDGTGILDHGVDRPDFELPAGDPRILEKPGELIGPYKLREMVGEGGMGVVYVAEQTEPVRRKVALKIIKPGMDTKEVVARFEAERQALALMNHPNIARVFDVGATESGRPYFVMELVRGVPINEFCDHQRLSTSQRLELFVDVCRAVQHAHQKGIIHRDLKPSNVLVSEIDGSLVPKVIDFGVAKAVNQKLVEQTVYTQFSQMIGTPLYMSPEQAGTGVVDVDTRSDVYSLGVLLYELLTGSTPFDRDTMKNAGFDEVRRIIREEEPSRPSAHISTLQAETLSTLASSRRCDPRRLRDSLKGELDWIVMKALEKDRNRRYESASDLAEDVQRHLNNEPVEACPPTVAYRLRKYVRRHRALMATTAIVALTMVLGTGISLWQMVEAQDARKLADQRLDQVEIERNRAEIERNRALNAEMQMATNLKWALAAIEDLGLAITGKSKALLLRGVDVTPVSEDRSRTRLLTSTLRFYEAFAEHNKRNPITRIEAAKAYRRVGRIYLELGDLPAAKNAISRSIAIFEDHSTTRSEDTFNESGRAYVELAWLADRAEHMDDARQARHKALEAFEGVIQLMPNNQLRSREPYYNRALVYADLGNLEQARFELDRLLDIDPNIPNEKGHTHQSYNDVAWFLVISPNPELRDPARAVELAEIAVARNPPYRNYLNTLGVALYRAGHYQRAVHALERSIGQKKVLPDDTLPLAMSLWKLGDKERAGRWYLRSIRDGIDPRTGLMMGHDSGLDVRLEVHDWNSEDEVWTLFMQEAQALGIDEYAREMQRSASPISTSDDPDNGAMEMNNLSAEEAE